MEVNAAEKEASEVLHTLLAVERIQDTENNRPRQRSKKQTKNATRSDDESRKDAVEETIQNVQDTDRLTNSELIGDRVRGDEAAIVTGSPGKNRKGKKGKSDGDAYDPTRLEDNAHQVLERFKRGCECQDDQCFSGLNPETVYRHRLNIAELTKGEHDMYLMGVTMACLTNPYQTARNTERRRLRAQYVYQGRRVCLDAFLYLENCTHYQIKRIRKHLVTHGVTPRVHGNHGKVPHNTFSLDIYQIATEFLKAFVKEQEASQKTTPRHGPLHLSPDVTRKTVHDLYTEYCKKVSPAIKVMGYSTFRRFMKVQFPQVKFAKLEFVVRGQTQSHTQTQTRGIVVVEEDSAGEGAPEQTDTIVPIIVTNASNDHNAAYYLTPIDDLQDGISYQLTSSGYLVNQSGVPLTVTNVTSI